MTVYAKDPSSAMDYSFDWANWLTANETITSTNWTVDPSGSGTLVFGNAIETGSVRGRYVSGGQVGHRYRLSCKIVTSAGRTAERSVIIRVMER